MRRLDGTIEIGKCPKCNEPIRDKHFYSFCSECGQQLPEGMLALLPHVQRTGPPGETPKPSEPEVFPTVGPQPFRLFSFKGRINRAKFLPIILFVVGLTWTIIIMMASESNAGWTEAPGTVAIIIPIFITIWWVGLATQIKRWHDMDLPGWMVLINAIPMIGSFISFIWLACVKGTQGPNKYGPNPLLKRPTDDVNPFLS